MALIRRKISLKELLAKSDGLRVAEAVPLAMQTFVAGRRTVERALTELSTAELIERRQESRDRRVRTIRLTDKGREALNDASDDLYHLRATRQDAQRREADPTDLGHYRARL